MDSRLVNKEQEILFNDMMILKSRINTLAGFVQNPLEDMGVTPDMLQEFIDLSNQLQKDIKIQSDKIVEFILREVSK